MEYDIIEIGSRIRKQLPKKRFWHTVGVAYSASDMALIFGESGNRALIAGLLHDFAKYLSEGKQVKVIITGSADASPIRGRIAYRGQYGEFVDEPYYKDGNLDNITVTKASGITTNEQLALLRAAGVMNYIEANVSTLRNTQNEYEYHVEVAKERGGEFRKINVEFLIMDAFPVE